jgi:hypothetical protein
MIKKPGEAKFANKHFILLIYGLPGVGKSTLALSAPRPFYLDVDQGAVRVRREHLKDYDDTQVYKEMLATLATVDPVNYDTIIIDTVGAMIESQKAWAAEVDPKNALKRDGGFALAGYGIIKAEYARLFRELSLKFNVILVFHAVKEKHGDDIFYDLVCEGAAKVFSWQPADLGCYMFVENGRRRLGFTPQSEYSAKSGHGIKGIQEVPELKPGEPNTFLTDLFALARENIAADDVAGAQEREDYDRIMAEGKKIIADVKDPDDVSPAAAKMKALGKALTSEPELRGQMSARLKELGIAYDKAAKKYYLKESPKPEPEQQPQEQQPAAEANVPGGGLF